MNYEGIRAMFEAYSHRKYGSTGVIQWMLNNAWPSTIWHLYDFYLRPGGGYFGAKIAMEPVHPMYAYDDRSVWVVSSRYDDVKGLKLTTKVYGLDMTEKFTQESSVDAGADSTNKVLTLPAMPEGGDVYPCAAPRRQHGQISRLEFLLALGEAGDPGLGENQLVRDSDLGVCQLHGAQQTPQSYLKNSQPDRTRGRRIRHPCDA